ncbi:AAA family ATPase [Trichococcus shcherbakoviae]|uniref:AAA family ATPase n=1 Tax=Trichococcus shcherbakoviae TaxID=2094020 RepID=UPI0029F4E1E4|nr:AAA family ATPase [Trichococcus shcherbakoviae]
MDDVQKRIDDFKEWSAENLGEKTGLWYAPYLERIGELLKKFEFEDTDDLKENFFYYGTYQEFESVYRKIFGESDISVELIINGKNLRYPKESVLKIKDFTQKFAQHTFEKGERSKPENFGGIPSLGTICRAYLRFLYYHENPQLMYPKKNEKIKTQEGIVDDSINYWIFSAGEQSLMWEEFYNSAVMGLGWDYLGNLADYSTRESIEAKMREIRGDGIHPKNDSKAVWEFLHDVQIGDVVYVKKGTKRIVGRGIVTSDYYFDNSSNSYKHRRTVDWTNKGEWDLRDAIAQKTLTKFNQSTDWIDYAERLINGEEIPDEKTKFIKQFELWLANQKLPSGEVMDEKSVRSRVNALVEAEKILGKGIFGESDPNMLEDLRDEMLKNRDTQNNRVVITSSFDYYLRYLESRPVVKEEIEAYTKREFLNDVFIDEKGYDRLVSLLQNKKNLILKGAPGVGKTFMADRLAYSMMGSKDDSRLQFVQFHQSYSYEDFIEGFRPKEDGDGFERKTGPFVKFARKASEDKDRDYFFIIDEINRGNMSKVFGELMMLIESDKRGKSINLLYSNEPFSVPENLYIIGMMNTADRSLALLDYALRRRFAFVDVVPAFDSMGFERFVSSLDNSSEFRQVIGTVKQLNKDIRNELGSGFEIGHSYFVDDAYKISTNQRLKEVIDYEIGPQLMEFWFDDPEKAKQWIINLQSSMNYEE